MREFGILVTRLFAIAMIQFVVEMFVDKKEHPRHIQMLEIACILGGFVLLLQFARTHLMYELAHFLSYIQ